MRGAKTAHGTLPGSLADIRQAEKPDLMPLSTACDGVVEPGKRVSPTGLITFDRSRCFVPASFANRPASPYICPERLVIVLEARLWRDVVERPVICTSASSGARRPGRVIHGRHHCLAPRRRPPGPNPPVGPEPMAPRWATHRTNGGQRRTVADSGGQRRTMADSGAIRRKPGARHNGGPFVAMPDAFRKLHDQMLRKPGGDREPDGNANTARRPTDGRYPVAGSAS